MKANKFVVVAGLLAFQLTGCRDKEVYTFDSPFITITSPAKNQSFQDRDSVTVKAFIEPQKVPVEHYFLILLDNEKKVILNEKVDCDCHGKTRIDLERTFLYDINKTSDLLLQLVAHLEDGTDLREEVRFKLVDSKK